MDNKAQLISRNALNRDFLDLGIERCGDVSYLMFMEKRTGRGLVAIDNSSEAKLEIVSEILFSKLRRKFSTRVFNEEFAVNCTWELWGKMAQFANDVSVEGFKDLIHGDVPPEFMPSVSLAQLQEFLLRREISKINHELNTHAAKITTHVILESSAVNSDFDACLKEANDDSYSLAA